MAVPQHGTYRSEDGNFSLEIKTTNSSNGQISGTYEAQYSPEGPLTVTSDTIAMFSWVENQQGKAGVAPFGIGITATVRPEDEFPYCIYDRWAGAYLTDNSLLMEGCRSYVNNKGVVETMSLGTLRFAQ